MPDYKSQEAKIKVDTDSRAVASATSRVAEAIPLKLPPQASESAHRAMLNAAKNKDQTGFDKIYGTSAAVRAPPKETAYTITRDIFLEERRDVCADGAAAAIKRHDDATRDLYLGLGKGNAREQAENNGRKSAAQYESTFLTNVGQKLDNDVQREDMLRAAREVGFNSEAIRNAGTQLSISTAFLNSILGPATALAAETAMQQQLLAQQLESTEKFAADAERKRKEDEEKTREESHDENAKEEAKGKKNALLKMDAEIDPHLYPEIEKINQLDAITPGKLSNDPQFLDAFEMHRDQEWSSHIRGSQPSIGGRRRDAADISTYSPVLQGAMLTAYRKSREDYQKRQEG